MAEKSVTEKNDERRRACVSGLRQLADFIEANPSLPVPYGDNLNVFVGGKDDLARLARVGGVRWEKNATADYFYLKTYFDGGHSYEINIERQKVCRKVVTGTRVEPAKPSQVVEEFHWVCDEPLLAGVQ